MLATGVMQDAIFLAERIVETIWADVDRLDTDGQRNRAAYLRDLRLQVTASCLRIVGRQVLHPRNHFVSTLVERWVDVTAYLFRNGV